MKFRGEDLTSRKFGQLTVLSLAGIGPKWHCQCTCGKATIVFGSNLVRGRTKSCGCNWRQALSDSRRQHGQSQHGPYAREYAIWKGMRARCNNPNTISYQYYGAKGIRVCRRWNDFTKFLADMGPRPTAKHSIERKKSKKHYTPKNCVWATAAEQGLNTSRNRRLTANNKTQTLSCWSRELGVLSDTIAARLSRGWTVERALFTPVRKKA